MAPDHRLNLTVDVDYGPLIGSVKPTMERFSHLARTFDFRLPSNVFAFAGSAAMGLLALIVDGSFAAAVAVGLTSFLGWVLGRELDPDRPVTAGVTVVGAGALALAIPPASPGIVYLLVLIGRVLGRTTGRSPKWTDLAVHVPVAAWFSQSATGWVAAMAFAFAVARDAALPRPAPRWQLWWSLATAVAATAVVTVTDGLGSWATPSLTADLVVVLGLIGAVMLARPEPIVSVGDITGEALVTARIRYTRVLIALAALGAVLIAGDDAIRALGAVWVAFAAGGALRITGRNTR